MYALSDAQKRLWFMNQLQRTAAYNVPVALRLRGPLDTAATNRAVADVVARHEVLRTRYPSVNDEPVQDVVTPDAVTDLVERRTVGPATLEDTIRKLSTTVLDIEAELPVRAWLLEVSPEHHVLLLLVHHIAIDGWSVAPLLRDLATAYRARAAGATPDWSELPVQYADYVAWHRQLLGDPDDDTSIASQQTAYWRKMLSGIPEQLTLPYDRSRPTSPSHRGDTVIAEIDVNLHRSLLALAREHNVTLFMVLQAALAVLLNRHGAGGDIPLGSPVAGRTDDALDDLVGFFVNTLVLRTDVSGDPSFSNLLRRVRDVDLSAYAHQDVPFEHLVRTLNPARSRASHPLFQVMLVLQNNSDVTFNIPGVEVDTELVPNGGSKFDLTVGFSEKSGPRGEPAGILAIFEYAADLFDRNTIEPIAERMVRILRSVVANPDVPVSQIQVLDDAQRQVLTETWRSRSRELRTWHAWAAFESQAIEEPDRVAVVCGDTELSYRELRERATEIAGRLTAYGIAQGDLVSVCLPRGADLVVTLLGVLRAGGGYSVLDPTFPPERLVTVVGEAASPLVITDRARAPRVEDSPVPVVALEDLAGTEPVMVPCPSGPDDPFCVMFTSGSTGRPKGVVATHRALVSTVVDQDYAHFGGETVLQCSPVSWDAFALELFGPLLSGGTAVLQPGERPEPAVIADLIRRHRVTTAYLSASLMNFMLDEYPGVFAGVCQLMTGGEPASIPHVATALRNYPGLTLVNGYSPVENMIFTLCHTITAEDLRRPTIPVGTPLADKQVYVLDEHLALVPPGVAGELYMAGDALALGYAGQPGLTAERFVANPFGPLGTRMYRTGDLVRWRQDGVMEFLGRVDDQVKVRGFRIEPREIEAVLAKHPALTKSAVVVCEDTPGDKRLVAYVVPRQGRTPDVDDLRALAMRHLPTHLVPSAFVPVDHLPLTPNGKLDKAALPTPGQRESADRRAPRNDLERSLCALFEEVLSVGEVGVDDDFFALGGHSLLATKLVSRARSRLGRELTITAVFDQSTVAGLALYCETAAKARLSLTAVSAARLSKMS